MKYNFQIKLLADDCFYFLKTSSNKRGDYKQKLINSDKLLCEEIAISADCTLYILAKEIIRIFDLEPDHYFGFYDNVENLYYQDSKRKYELAVDLGDEMVYEAEGVKNIKVKTIWKKIGDKMILIYDYGDKHRFLIELKEEVE